MLSLIRKLYPKGGLIFNLFLGSKNKALHEAICDEMNYLKTFVDDGLDSFFPDNNSFTTSDATMWETKYGIETDTSISLSQRRSNLIQRIKHPGGEIYRQTRSFIEAQLRNQGFDVRVYENTLGQTPEEIFPSLNYGSEFGNSEFGNSELGFSGIEIIGNSSDLNENYVVGNNNYWATFIISGSSMQNQALVPSHRRKEFRKAVLRVKPAHMAALVLVNYYLPNELGLGGLQYEL